MVSPFSSLLLSSSCSRFIEHLNHASLLIVTGQYDEAIVTLSNAIQPLKITLASATAAAGSAASSDSSCTATTTKLTCNFYTYPLNSGASPFLKTRVLVPDDNVDDIRSDTTNNSREQQQKLVELSIFRPPLLVCYDDDNDDNGNGGFDSATTSSGTRTAPSSSVSSNTGTNAKHMKHICEQLSYVTIYNIALSYQLKAAAAIAIQYSQQQEQEQDQLDDNTTARKELHGNVLLWLKKSLKLYEHSHQMLMDNVQRQHEEEEAMDNNTTSITHQRHRSVMLHKMAIVTNLRYLYHVLQEHTTGALCRTNFVAIVTSVRNQFDNEDGNHHQSNTNASGRRRIVVVIDTIFQGDATMMEAFLNLLVDENDDVPSWWYHWYADTKNDHAAAAA